jgi:sortase A
VRWLFHIDRALLVIGIFLIALYVAATAHRSIMSAAAIEGFKAGQARTQTSPDSGPAANPQPDFALWSPARIVHFREAIAKHSAPAVGILRIPKSHIEAPILEGTDEVALNEGVGHIPGTDPVGGPGNTGIAGHRDGFFRGLKDVQVGDTIQIETRQGALTYTVDRMIIVDPHDVSVLGAVGHPAVTLVTCYPFYTLGNAPRRFIVQASRVQSDNQKRKE